MVNIIKKFFLLPLKFNLLGAIIRVSIIFFIFFTLMPKFNTEFKDFQFRMEILILIIILVEILIWETKFSSGDSSALQETKQSNITVLEDLSKGNKNILIGKVLDKRPCVIFLHTPNIVIDRLLLNYNYLLLDLYCLKDTGLNFYENYNGIIINTEIEKFNALIGYQNAFIVSLMRSIKKNNCDSLNLMISIDDLINLETNNSVFCIKLYSCLQFINKNLDKAISTNFIIDDLSKFEGFYTLFGDISNKEREEMLGISFIVSINDISSILEIFFIKFKELIQQIENLFIQKNYKNPLDYQLAYMFIYQFSELREPIAKLLECIVLPKKRSLIKRKNNRLITISFISTTNNSKINPTIMLQKFASYFGDVKIKNE